MLPHVSRSKPLHCNLATAQPPLTSHNTQLTIHVWTHLRLIAEKLDLRTRNIPQLKVTCHARHECSLFAQTWPRATKLAFCWGAPNWLHLNYLVGVAECGAGVGSCNFTSWVPFWTPGSPFVPVDLLHAIFLDCEQARILHNSFSGSISVRTTALGSTLEDSQNNPECIPILQASWVVRC